MTGHRLHLTLKGLGMRIKIDLGDWMEAEMIWSCSFLQSDNSIHFCFPFSNKSAGVEVYWSKRGLAFSIDEIGRWRLFKEEKIDFYEINITDCPCEWIPGAIPSQARFFVWLYTIFICSLNRVYRGWRRALPVHHSTLDREGDSLSLLLWHDMLVSSGSDFLLHYITNHLYCLI
jgi:hypothetical protein